MGKIKKPIKAEQYETYEAVADAKIAKSVANTTSPFTITVRFLGGLTPNQKKAFQKAADRWTKVIVGDLPSVVIDGEVIDDILILAQGVNIDGVGGILGQAGPTRLRPATAGNAAFLPARGTMSFDTADLKNMEQNNTLVDVITHEMGHVLGIGTVWTRKGLLKDAGTTNPTFTGKQAKIEFGKLKGVGPTPVPVANVGGPGTADSHWRESVFRNELMTGSIAGMNNPMSAMTVASLQDLGYEVDVNAAEPYSLPNLLAMAESGMLLASEDTVESGMVMTSIPIVLPDSSLQ
ncbi:MAG: leishmanolysin-related zinc metalloendopeptidase [Pyrinomonadaceae bacterium]